MTPTMTDTEVVAECQVRHRLEQLTELGHRLCRFARGQQVGWDTLANK